MCAGQVGLPWQEMVGRENVEQSLPSLGARDHRPAATVGIPVPVSPCLPSRGDRGAGPPCPMSTPARQSGGLLNEALVLTGMLTKAKAGQVGVLFDDFDYYTASTDSRLAQRGWVMRSGAGGPGVPGATWSPKAVTFPRLGDGPVLQLESTTTGSGCNTIQSVGDCAVDIRRDFNGIQHREPPAIRRCALCGLQLCLAGLTDGPLAEARAACCLAGRRGEQGGFSTDE